MSENQPRWFLNCKELLEEIEKHASIGATELYCSKPILYRIFNLLTYKNVLSDSDKTAFPDKTAFMLHNLTDETPDYKEKFETAINKYMLGVYQIKVFYDSTLPRSKDLKVACRFEYAPGSEWLRS